MSEQPADPTTPPEPVAPAAAPQVSAIERVRRTPMAPAAVALGVSLVAGIVLSFLVPDKPGALAMIVLGAAVAAAVGFTVRYLASDARGWTLGVAAVAAAFGVHLMAVTGSLQGGLGPLEGLGVEGPGFNDALLAALTVPPFSMGTLLAAAIAALIAGWGRPRS